ncbi:TIR domain-containing protein [Cyanobacteria bacterium FACHB-472]|nr:TIR domain-containing protein [Cyanobacteria bacterium FACHB-472]
MWLILLDRSGSMGKTFSSKSEFTGRSRQSKLAVKLDAAKEALRSHLLGLGSPSQIALFEFTFTTSLIFEGMSDDSIGIRQALDSLSATNGTNIATALTKAFEYTNQVQNVNIFRVLVISDGLSDREQAERAARQLAAKPSLIDVILIDPTENGEAVARAIAINGTVSAVTSAKELTQEVSEVEQRQAQLAREAEAIISKYEQAAQSFAARERPEERLSFTAGYPGTILPETWYPFWVYLHLARLQDEVTEKLRQNATKVGLRASISTAESASRLKRGTWLRLTPRVDGVVFNPPSQEVVWYEDIQEVSFRLQAESNVKGPRLGSVEVYSESLLIALIPLSLNVRQSDVSDEADQPVTSSAQIFNRIFASYSRKDESIVDACVAAYEALGIYVYIDKKSLKSGESWHVALQKFIQESDLFQLYWSHASSQSSNVEDEWRHALNLMNTGDKHETFIRPLRWEEDWPVPPKNLSPINFARLDLFALERYTGRSLPSFQTQSPTSRLSVINYPALPVTVVPLLPNASSESQGTILEDVAYGVNFLEETTGLRYYPVPTLLVDELITNSVRAINTTDLDPVTLPNELKERILKLADVLNSIALKFHCHDFYPRFTDTKYSWDDLDSYFGKRRLLTEEQFDRVRHLCECLIPRTNPYGRKLRDDIELNSILNPYGRKLCDELISLKTPHISSHFDFVSFFDKLLKTISMLLKEGLKELGDFSIENRFSIEMESYHLLQKEIPDLKLDLQLPPNKWSSEKLVLLRGQFSEFVRVFQIVALKLIEALRQIAHLNTPIQKLFAVEVPTYGIYVPPNSPDSDDCLKLWAFKRGIATELTLSNTPRVLFCLEAHEHFKEKLQRESVERRKSSRLARDFQRSVLVHEHFHAILETGLDGKRSPAHGPKFKKEWQAAYCLNESLAVWMELHDARQNQELMALIWDYIRAESYPRWPYRGAEKVEEIYQQRGIGAVRELIMSIRNDPETAQLAFDSLPSKLNSGLL